MSEGSDRYEGETSLLGHGAMGRGRGRSDPTKDRQSSLGSGGSTSSKSVAGRKFLSFPYFTKFDNFLS